MKRGFYPFKCIAVILLVLALIWAVPCVLHTAFAYPLKNTVILHTSHHLIELDAENSSSNTASGKIHSKESSPDNKSLNDPQTGVVIVGCIFIAFLIFLHHGKNARYHDKHVHHQHHSHELYDNHEKQSGPHF